MKKTLILFAFILFNTCIWAQVPQKMSYQAVIRNSANALVVNTTVGIKISVLQGSSSGSAVYSETHITTTNANGLVSLQIGSGSVLSGTFAGINWANGPYFIKTETDPAGGNNYSISGTSELLSVPYALSAGQSSPAPGNAVGDIQYWNGTAWVLLPIGSAGQVLKVNNNIPQWSTPAPGILSAVTTDSVTDVKVNMATATGTVVSDGGEFVLTRGFCYGTSPNPTVTNGAITSNNGLGSFSADINGLNATTTYYVRAFSTTTAGTAYGNQLSFTTTNGIATVTTVGVTDILECQAQARGIVASDGGDPIIQSGICYSTNPNPTITDNPQNAGGSYDFTLTIQTSQPNTVYYYRAYATNSTGTFYGSVLSFTTQNFTANVVTNPATAISSCSATLSMNYTNLLPNAAQSFGICYSTSPLPTTENNTVFLDSTSLTTTLNCLSSNTTYYVRGFIENCNGLKYGNSISFTTSNNPFIVTTPSPTVINACNIQIPQGTITYNNGDSSCFGQIIGLYYSTTPNPGEGNGTLINSSPTYYLNGLTANTTYYARLAVIKCDGQTIVYGNQVQFNTLPKYTSLITNAATTITAGTAFLSGNFIGNGTDYLWLGFCISTSQNPTMADRFYRVTGNSNSSNYGLNINGLIAGTTYYVRTYAEQEPNCIGTNYGNQISFTTTAGPLVVGQNYNGGIIIKLNTPTSGLMVTPTSQGTTAWGCEGINIATSSAEGTGQANTNAIISGCSTAGTAARICDNLVFAGFSNWYLPSEAEMTLVGNLDYFPSGNYWTSTQSSNTMAKIINGATIGTANKSDASIKVLAVRNF